MKATRAPSLPLQDSSNVRDNVNEEMDGAPVALTKKRSRIPINEDEDEESMGDDDEDVGEDEQGLQMAQESGSDEEPGYDKQTGNDDDDDDDDDESLEQQDGDQTLPPEAPNDGHFYSADFGRKLLKVSALKNTTMVFNFVVNEVFKDLKFTEGDDDQEMELVRLAYEDGYVKIGDPKVTLDSFVTEYYTHIAKSVTLLRQRSVNAARKKFQSKFSVCRCIILMRSNLGSSVVAQLKIDLKNKDLPDKPDAVLPPNLGEILAGVFLRNYTDGGEVIEIRRGAYECYKWFVKNILFCVNFELTDQLSKQVSEVGYLDFISKAYSASDEAFAILVVLNYEHRWRNQVLEPTKSRKLLATDPLYACKWTSSQKGYCKLPWESAGIDKYNELLGKIVKLRGTPRSGIDLEAMIKKEFEVVKPIRKRKTMEVIEIRPKMGGALQQKLAARKKN